MIQWHRSDLENRMYVPLEDGKKIAMPRYYKKKIYSDSEREWIGKKMSEKDSLLPQLTEQQRVSIVKDRHDRFYKNQRLQEKL